MKWFIIFLFLIPYCGCLLWQQQPRPLKLMKDKTDTCDFENSTCDVTYFQASDWFRGHEHKWIRWFRLQVTDFISNNFAEFFRFPPVVEWVRMTGSNVTDTQNAPISDHTTQTAEGTYMYLHASVNDGYSVSVLLQTRKYLSVHPQVCFRYWYQLRSDATMMLAVVIRNESQQEVKIIQPNTLKTGKTDHTTDWKEAVYTLEVPVNEPFKIAIVGAVRDLVDDEDDDSIAIDDLQVKMGRCRGSRPYNIKKIKSRSLRSRFT